MLGAMSCKKGEINMKQYQFREWELSEEAYEVYSNSSFMFYKHKDIFFVADNQNSEPYEVGSLIDVENFLRQFSD